MTATAKTLHDRILAVQKAVHALNLVPGATGQVQSRTYKYLTIQKLHEAVMPILHEQGLVWGCLPTSIQGLDGDVTPALAYSLSDGTTDIGATIPLVGCGDMQRLGSAITYARRYVLLSVLGLVPDVDDDGAEASAGPQTKSTGAQKKSERAAAPQIPIDRAKSILEAAQSAGLADGLELKPALAAKLAEVGVETGKLGHLNVDQAEAVEEFIAKEAA